MNILHDLFAPPFRVRILNRIPASLLPWHHDALLVLVEGSTGRLRWTPATSRDGTIERVLAMGDTPLIVVQSEDEYWCPTCERLLSRGLGREHLDPTQLDLLRQATLRPDLPLEAALEHLEPLFRLLTPGLHVLSRIPHHPTDGEGHPFWALSRTPRRHRASMGCWLFGQAGLYEVADAWPTFLLPTQTMDLLDWETVEAYRRKLRGGEDLGGLAMADDSFLSGLLDGHHRATAALLEGRPLTCLTLIPTTGFEHAPEGKLVRIWDERIPVTSLPPAAQRLLETSLRPTKPVRLAALDPAEWPERRAADSPHWPALEAAARTFPTAEGLAALQVVGDLSDTGLEILLASQDEDAESRIWLAMKALVASSDPRAIGLALAVARSPRTRLWQDAFRVLAAHRREDVEEFFVRFTVDDDGSRPWLTAIADAYLTA